MRSGFVQPYISLKSVYVMWGYDLWFNIGFIGLSLRYIFFLLAGDFEIFVRSLLCQAE